MAKNIIYGKQSREKLKKGVDTLANAVRVTLGAKGRHVIIEADGVKHFGYPHITKDGVTVANSIQLEDNQENMGAAAVINVANKTADIAGDGTTTATVLAQAIIEEGFTEMDNGANPMDLKRGIEMATEFVVEKLKTFSKPVNDLETLEQISTISANNDSEMGKIIAQVMHKVGKDGVVTVEESGVSSTFINFIDGFQVDKGCLSYYFFTNQNTGVCEMEKPFILLYDRTISHMKDLIPLLQNIVIPAKRPLLIIAEDVDGQALETLVVNRLKHNLPVCAIKCPDYGENRKSIMQDIAIATGATFITRGTGYALETIKEEHLGSAEKISSDLRKTLIIKGSGTKQAVETRSNEIKSHLEQANLSNADKQNLKNRYAKINNGIAVLKVGASSETEIKEKKDRIDDALKAARASLEEGYVCGGGTAYVWCSKELDLLKGKNADQDKGINIVKKAILSPMKYIVQNAGLTFSDTLEQLLNSSYGMGMNVKTDVFEDLFKAGVIDPTKVSRVALESASSVAGIFLTTECCISEKLK